MLSLNISKGQSVFATVSIVLQRTRNSHIRLSIRLNDGEKLDRKEKKTTRDVNQAFPYYFPFFIKIQQ